MGLAFVMEKVEKVKLFRFFDASFCIQFFFCRASNAFMQMFMFHPEKNGECVDRKSKVYIQIM